jgi:LytS/YehU family sensor histidine kinase
LKIAPLILQPFIENAFKHTPKDKASTNYISLNMNLDKNKLTVNVCNNYIIDDHSAIQGGIGLDNVKKRLGLIYKGNYNLAIDSTNNVYTVLLQINLKS